MTGDNFHFSESLQSTGLGKLYAQLKDGNERGLSILGMPKVVIRDPANDKYSAQDQDLFHEAGFDAFSCGLCFVKMAHISARLKI